MQTVKDPARSSFYVDETFYAELVESFRDWQRDDRAILDAGERDAARALLEREARLLDRNQLADWLALYTPECLYWAPATPEGGDPRREVAVCFDDRRRLEDRIYRFRTGYAWSQAPASRTVRLITNVEVFAAGRDDARMLRSNFLISEFWGDETRVLTGWAGHRVVRDADGWKIQAKQVNLIDCDQSIRNPSIVF